MDGMGWMGWDGSPGGPRYRAPTVLISSFSMLSKDFCAKLKDCTLMREISHIMKFKLSLKFKLTLNMLTLFNQSVWNGRFFLLLEYSMQIATSLF